MTIFSPTPVGGRCRRNFLRLRPPAGVGEKNLEAYSLLKSNYYCLDFVGQRYDKKTSVTSLFFGEKLAKKVYV